MVGYNPSDSLFDSIFVFLRDVPPFMRQEKSTSLRKSNLFYDLRRCGQPYFVHGSEAVSFTEKSKVNTTWSTYTKLIATWWIEHAGLVEGFVDTKTTKNLVAMEEESVDLGSGQVDNEFSADPYINPTLLSLQSAWYSFVFTLGVIGNIYIILTVWCRKEMSSTINWFIVNLAFSDLGILLISLPAEYIRDYFSWPFNKLTCQLFVPLNEVFFCVSIFTLTIITIERFRVICRPFKPRLTEKKAKIVIVLVWIVAYLAVGLPVSFLMEVEKMDSDLKCLLKWPGVLQRRLHTCFIATLVIVPLLITAAGYAAIVSTMRKQSSRIRARTNSISSNSLTFRRDMICLQQNAKLIKMLLLIVIVFWVCMMPLAILALANEFGSINIKHGLSAFCVALFFSNSAFNPIAVYVMSSELREGLYRLFQRVLTCFTGQILNELWQIWFWPRHCAV